MKKYIQTLAFSTLGLFSFAQEETGVVVGNNIYFSFGTPCHSSQIVGYDTVFVSVDSLVMVDWSDTTHKTCAVLPPTTIYPAQQNDDYLNEDRFDGLYHVVLYDHIVTRKNINVFFPTLSIPADFCGIDQTLTHPTNGQRVVFKDMYNWIDEEGRPIFNLNKQLYKLWELSDLNLTLDVEVYHNGTGQDLSFGHDSVNLKMNGVEIFACDTTIISDTLSSSIFEYDAKELKIFPNPCTNEVQITWNMDINTPDMIQIYSVQGQLMHERKVSVNEQSVKLNFELPKGCYFVNMRSKGKLINKGKLLIVRN